MVGREGGQQQSSLDDDPPGHLCFAGYGPGGVAGAGGKAGYPTGTGKKISLSLALEVPKVIWSLQKAGQPLLHPYPTTCRPWSEPKAGARWACLCQPLLRPPAHSCLSGLPGTGTGGLWGGREHCLLSLSPVSSLFPHPQELVPRLQPQPQPKQLSTVSILNASLPAFPSSLPRDNQPLFIQLCQRPRSKHPSPIHLPMYPSSPFYPFLYPPSVTQLASLPFHPSIPPHLYQPLSLLSSPSTHPSFLSLSPSLPLPPFIHLPSLSLAPSQLTP